MTIPVSLEQRTSKNDKTYIALVADLGYTKKVLAFGRDALEICNVSPRDVSRDVGVILEGVLEIYDD